MVYGVTYVTFMDFNVTEPRPTRRRDMHPEEIKAAVRMTGITLTALALQAGLSESACRNALRKKSGRADEAIAVQIGKSLEAIWPSRYGRKSSRHVRDHSARLKTAHRLSAEAV